MPDQISSLEQLVAAREQARETLQELHGLLKDCKQMKKDIITLLSRGAAVLVFEAVTREIEDATSKVATHFDHATAEAVREVNKKFREVSKLLDDREETVQNTVEIVQALTKTLTDYLDRQEKQNAKRNDRG